MTSFTQRRARALWPALILVVTAGCRSGLLTSRLLPPSPHEQYAASLREAGLETAALGRGWLAAADDALGTAVPRTLPFRETGYLAPERPETASYRFPLARGQRLVAQIEWQASEPARLFVDLFTAPAGEESPRRIRSAGPDAPSLEHEADRGGDYLLRLQPELLRGGRYTVVIRTAPSLAFPVEGRNSRAIGGLFGEARDGGRRRHEGIDIFAPRGTHALAASDGLVLSADSNALGGNVVWLWDAGRGLTYYYAHLDAQTVRSGERVRAGDVVGLIGNTGNARAASPHLHFAIYRHDDGAIDATPYIATSSTDPPALTADAAALATWRRISDGALPLASAPLDRSSAVRSLKRYTIVRVSAATGGWYRVALPGGESGFVAARGTEPAERPLRRERRRAESSILDHPGAGGVLVENVPAGTELSVHGLSGEYVYVRTPGLRTGWLASEAR